MNRSYKKLIRGFLRNLKEVLAQLAEEFKPSKTAVRGAAYGMLLVSAIMLIIFISQVLPYIGVLPVLAFILIVAAMALLAGLLFNLLFKLLFSIPALIRFAIVAAFVAGSFQFNLSAKTGLPVLASILFFSSLACGAAWMLVSKRWKKFDTSRKVKVAVFGLTGVAGLFTVIFWLVLPGSELEMPEIAALKGDYLPDHIELSDPGSNGPYTVLELTYGSGTDRQRGEYAGGVAIKTDSVDGSFFVDGWEGFSGKLRTRFFGFDLKALPRNARVWYPDGRGPFPLVLIVHGNHLAQDFSDPGYDYLGKLLASRGYILASVDENFLNSSYANFNKGLRTENDARGWMLLEHLRLWREWNADSTSIFFEKADMEKISLIGHSRGGEAVAHAALFNRLPYYPDNAKVEFEYNFNIRSIVAIAPVDGQYQPAGIRTPLKDIDYFVFHGSHDADLQSFIGMRQYERVTFSEHYGGFKAALYIYGANHGQFNTRWGRRDYGIPMVNLLNIKQLLPAADQEKIAGTFISAFLEITLSGKEGYLELFRDYRTGRNWLPETVYLNRFDQAGMQYICRYSEDLNLVTTTLPGGSIETGNLTVWKERMVQLKWGDKETRAVFIGWNNNVNDSLTACYSVSIPEREIIISEDSYLFFSLADANENSNPHPKEEENGPDDEETVVPDEEEVKVGDDEEAEVPDEEEVKVGDDEETVVPDEEEVKVGNDEEVEVPDNEEAEMPDDEEENEDREREPIDFTVKLTDLEGEVISFRLSDHAFLQPQVKAKLPKLAFMKTAPESEPLYHFFYFPLKRFLSGNDRFSVENLVRITFQFDQTEEGVIILDNLGFMQ